jgi:Anaphase-promoting complex subunit 11 RING-H2 finger
MDDPSASDTAAGSVPDNDSTGAGWSAGVLGSDDESRSPMEKLAIAFFLFAGLWLLMACLYCVLTFVYLRLKYRNEIHRIYDDPNFGRCYLPLLRCRFFCRRRQTGDDDDDNDPRCFISWGWFLRRYLHRLQMDQLREEARSHQRRMSRLNSTDEATTRWPRAVSIFSHTSNAASSSSTYYMTTLERRKAIADLLMVERKNDDRDVESGNAGRCANHENDDDASANIPVCGICLDPLDKFLVTVGEYNPCVDKECSQISDETKNVEPKRTRPNVMKKSKRTCGGALEMKVPPLYFSQTCQHVYHASCILDWLQRPGIRECPTCRKGMVSEDEIHEMVRRNRRRRVKFFRPRSASSSNIAQSTTENNGMTTASTENDDEVAEEGQLDRTSRPLSRFLFFRTLQRRSREEVSHVQQHESFDNADELSRVESDPSTTEESHGIDDERNAITVATVAPAANEVLDFPIETVPIEQED